MWILNLIVRYALLLQNKTYFKENVAMKAIVNGCENTSDVSDKEADFYHVLQYK